MRAGINMQQGAVNAFQGNSQQRENAEAVAQAQPKRTPSVLSVARAIRDVGPLVEGPGDVYICGDVH